MPSFWDYFLSILCTVLLSVFLRLIYLLKNRKYANEKKLKKCKLMAVFGSGGHTQEMVTLLKDLNNKYSPRIYILADTDQRSMSKIDEMDFKQYEIVRIRRSREVAQSWISTFFTTLEASIHSIYVVWVHQPDLVLCNGPGTCIPICGAAFLLKLCLFYKTRIMFVESLCRVETMSLSGKILYHFADRIIVQWPELAKKYPGVDYIGRIV